MEYPTVGGGWRKSQNHVGVPYIGGGGFFGVGVRILEHYKTHIGDICLFIIKTIKTLNIPIQDIKVFSLPGLSFLARTVLKGLIGLLVSQ